MIPLWRPDIRHYIASTAYTPSQTSLCTGHHPSLHGVSQTDGMAKSAHDVSWLAPDLEPGGSQPRSSWELHR